MLLTEYFARLVKVIEEYSKTDLNFNSHKHISTGETIQSGIPELSDILEEIMNYLL